MTSYLNIDLADKNGFYLGSLDMGKYYFFLQAAKTEVKALNDDMAQHISQKAIASELFSAKELDFIKDNLPTFTQTISVSLKTLQGMINYVKYYDLCTKNDNMNFPDYEGKFATLFASEVNSDGKPSFPLAKEYPHSDWWRGGQFDAAPARRIEYWIEEILNDYGVPPKDIIATFTIE